MVVLTAKYIVKAGRGNEVEVVLRRMAPLVKASEPECVICHATGPPRTPICSCSTNTTSIRPRLRRIATRRISRKS